MKPQLIVSASRRTDLPGFYATWTVRKLERIRRPIHSVFFWTKHPAAFIEEGQLKDLVQHKLLNPFLLLTITGLGGTRFEPNVPAWESALEATGKVISIFHSQPKRIRWRFDPVLPDVGAEKLFGEIAPRIGDLGISDCIISLPAAMSLKGPLHPLYENSKIPVWKESQARRTVEKILEIGEKISMKISSCATTRLWTWFPDHIEPASCINAETASLLHPEKIKIAHKKDPSQRKHCSCSLSEDIGSYTETLCGSGCLYCYSKAGGPRKAQGPMKKL